MKSRDYTTTLRVDAAPRKVFDAISDVRGWWAGEIDGETAKLDAEFTYRYENFHVSKQRIVELEPGKKIVWLVIDSTLNFIEDKSEWNGTRIEFEISRVRDKTEVRFTHVGLVESRECYGACSNAWRFLIGTSLRDFIVTGKGASTLEAAG